MSPDSNQPSKRRRATLVAVCVALAMLACTAVALAVKPAKGTYTGQTSQALFVDVKANAKGRIKRFRLDWSAKCDTGNTWDAGTKDEDLKDDPIKQPGDGSFSDSGKYTDTSHGFKGHFKIELGGKFTSATKANGTFKVKIRVTKDGKTKDHCHKTLSWHVG